MRKLKLFIAGLLICSGLIASEKEDIKFLDELFIQRKYSMALQESNNFITKYKNTKATYNYMKQMKTNMKNNPNWSNYHREQAEEKRMKNTQKPSFWDKFKK